MVEYLYNAIRATAGSDATIMAHITDNESEITSGCGFMLHLDDSKVIMFDGTYGEDGFWYFTIPAETSKDLKGRYWYCFCQDNATLCFKQPIYFI